MFSISLLFQVSPLILGYSFEAISTSLMLILSTSIPFISSFKVTSLALVYIYYIVIFCLNIINCITKHISYVIASNSNFSTKVIWNCSCCFFLNFAPNSLLFGWCLVKFLHRQVSRDYRLYKNWTVEMYLVVIVRTCATIITMYFRILSFVVFVIEKDLSVFHTVAQELPI